jgi:aminobenzoyl-glutamate utilization protein B
MSGKQLTDEKRLVLDYVDGNADALAGLCDSIFYFGELGMQEHETAGLMTSVLADAGFEIERGISGFPTGFMASYGDGAPVIALHTEYDANPNNSQQPGVTELSEIVAGAPGHCEGHNVNAAVMVTGALAVKSVMDARGIGGTLKVFGAPAEEQLLSRPYFVRDGYFRDVDIAFHDHVGGKFGTDYGLIQSALVSATFTFHGESAHAAMAPWKARDALDAVVLMDAGMAQYREHFEPGMSAHRAITNGGAQPNVIPPEATIWWYFRHPTAEGARKLFEQGCKIAEGAAMMTNCELEIDVMSAVWPVRGNQTLAQILQANIERVGMPQWSDEEQSLARDLQAKAGVAVSGLPPAIKPLDGPATQIAASNDSGDVSWVVPMGRLWFPANIPDIGFHHWTAGVAIATSIAHKAGVAGAKALAASVMDFLMDPDLVARAKASFADEIGEVEYKSLLPMEQQPPLELNHAVMEKFRPAMREHYRKEKPVFTS